MSSAGTPLRALTLGRALGWYAEGLREVPPGSNWGPTVARLLRLAGIHVPAPWCACVPFAASVEAAVLHELENPLLRVRRRALVADYLETAESRRWIVPPEEADAGCLVIYPWSHIGLLKGTVAPDGSFIALEGNTTSATLPEGTPDDFTEREGWILEPKARSLAEHRPIFALWDEGVVLL